MPGEPLVCVWQIGGKSPDQEASGRFSRIVRNIKGKIMNLLGKPSGVSRKVLEEALKKLQCLPMIKYSEAKFYWFFGQLDFIDFSKFKLFVSNHMCESEDSFGILQELIEDTCWIELEESVMKTFKAPRLSNQSIRQLWYIYNRLASEFNYPITVSAEAVNWFLDRMNNQFGTPNKVPSDVYENYNFAQFVEKVLVENKLSARTLAACVEHMYGWIVQERRESGWIRKRTRQNANWTDWSKRWAVLTPLGLLMFKDESEDLIGKQEMRFTSITKLAISTETVTDYPNRFKIQNLPYKEVEISTTSHQTLLRWTYNIRIILAETKSRITPVQRMLKDMFSTRKAVKMNELSKRLMHTQNLALGLMQANSSNHEVPRVIDNPIPDQFNISQTADDQMRAVFMKVDTSGNGVVDLDEFGEFMISLGLSLDGEDVKGVFEAIDTDRNGSLSYDEFADYFADILANKDNGGALETELRQAFLKADRDGSGTVNYTEISDWLLQSQQSICKEKVLNAFQNANGEISLDEFKSLCARAVDDKSSFIKGKDEGSVNRMEQKLLDFYSETDGDELTQFIQDRWIGFAAFRREGASGEVVMTGSDEIVKDFVPGNYSLIDMVCFSDLPPLEPDFTVVKGAVWKSSQVPGKSGKLICPKEYNGQIRISPATSEFLRYYGCSFAEGKSVTVSLMYRHAVQDFTYESAYLSDYVKNKNGGSGIEKHDFVHLDCPMEEDNGYFILGKFVSDIELHLTAFQVPIRHTLYLPANTIHSNDYLKGTWRTLLSDESAIDHVHLTKYSRDSGKTLENFSFQFVD